MRILLFILALVVTPSAIAQTLQPVWFPQLTEQPTRNLSLRKPGMLLPGGIKTNAAQKTTVIKERLIAESYRDGFPPHPLLDTIRYKYSGNNGSRFIKPNFTDHFFFETYNHSYQPGSGYDYPYEWGAMDVMADSGWHWQADTALALFLADQFAAGYNTGEKLDSAKMYYYNFGQLYGASYYYHIYDVNDRLVQIKSYTDTGTAPFQFQQIDYHYDANGRLLRDSLFGFVGNLQSCYGVISYSYDVAGNVTQIKSEGIHGFNGPWMNIMQYDYTWDANSRVKTFIPSYLGGPSWKDSMEYQGTNEIAGVTTRFTLDNNGSWTTWRSIIKHLNAQGLPDSISYLGGVGKGNFDKYTYTSYGNPKQRRYYSGSGSYEMLIGTHEYYYETYNDPTALDEVVTTEAIKIYPNPATTQLTLSWKEGVGKKIALQLTNTAGQVVIRAEISLRNETASLPIEHLPPGMYWLTVTNKFGTLILKEGLVKQ